MSLTDKQTRFVKAYLIGKNGKQAAIAAGYGEAGASVEANRLLKNAKVVAALDKAQQDALKPAVPKPAQQAKATPADVASVAFVPNLLAAMEVGMTPLDYMLSVMNDSEAECERRDKMAVSAAPYVHGKKGEGGKKEEKQDAAKKASAGKFAPSMAPRLVSNNRH